MRWKGYNRTDHREGRPCPYLDSEDGVPFRLTSTDCLPSADLREIISNLTALRLNDGQFVSQHIFVRDAQGKVRAKDTFGGKLLRRRPAAYCGVGLLALSPARTRRTSCLLGRSKDPT